MPNWQSSSVSSSLLLLTEAGTLLGNTGLFVTQGNDGIPFITSAASIGTTLTTNAVNTEFDPNNVQFTMSFLFPATTTNRTFTFMGRLQITSAMGFGTELSGTVAEGIIDFGNTGRFSLIVPADVTVTSASGQFLTAVPTPTAFGLRLSAVVGLAVRARRQARRHGGILLCGIAQHWVHSTAVRLDPFTIHSE